MNLIKKVHTAAAAHFNGEKTCDVIAKINTHIQNDVKEMSETEEEKKTN